MRKIFFILLIAITFTACYKDDYLNPELDKTIAYFASVEDYTRTVVVGEGLHFKIGAAMAGLLENYEDRTLEFRINQSTDSLFDDGRLIMPTSMYNASDLSGTVTATIPAGDILGYFTVKMDSVNFLNDSLSLTGNYTLPVKLVGTSLDTIGTDSVNVSVTYMCGVDGYYLFKSTVKREINGSILEDKTTTEEYQSEADDNTWRLNTVAPFSVEATSATKAFTAGLKFNITVKDGDVTLESIDGQPVVEPNGSNTYDSNTRDFNLNYKYQKAGNDTIYCVTNELIFRNRVRDGVNETRDYLSYLN
jgi:hypothetical protein